MEKIAQFFRIPQIYPDNERRRKLLNILLAISLVGAITTFVYTLYLDVENLEPDLVTNSLYSVSAMLTAGIACVYIINRYWSSRLASLIFAFVFIFCIALNTGDEMLYENIYLSLVIPILIASFLAFPWAGFLSAGFISLWVILVSQRIEELINFPAIMGYFVLASVSWLSSRSLERALDNLRSTNRELDQRIAERKQAEAALQQRNQELSFFNRAGQAFNSTLDLDEVLVNVFSEIRHSFSAIAWSIWLVDYEAQELVCHLVDGPRKERVQNVRLKIGEGIAGWTALHKVSALIPDASTDSRIVRTSEDFTEFDMRSVLSVPLIRKDNAIGVIQVLDFKPNLFTPSDQALLELLAASASAAVENAQLYEAAQREITERKRAETALRESETRYRTLIDTSPDAIIAYDQEGTILMCNPQAAVLYDASSIEELIGQNARELTAPEDQQRATETIQAILENKTTYNLELTQIKTDGTRFPVEASVAFFPDTRGGSRVLISTMRDITARKEAEAATARHHRELTALNTIATILNQKHSLEEFLTKTLDEILRVIGVDTGWIQLLEASQENSTPVITARSRCPEPPPTGLLPPTLRKDLVRQAQQTGELILIKNVTATFQHPGESQERQLAFPVAAFPIKAKTHVEGVLGVLGITDCQAHPLSEEDIQLLTTISHQIGTAVENIRLVKEAAEVAALRELDKLRAELIANFSHDLRTPLGLIKMSCTTLMRDDVQFERETQAACLEDIETQVDTLTEIVDNMLDLARIESGELKLDKHPIDLATLAREIVSAMKARLARHTITLDFPDAPLIAGGDPRHIAAVFRNLLDNAIKYAPEGSAITISGHAENGHVLVQVSDHGIGIPAESLNKVFERFYRVESKATRHIRGVGLGLPVCRGIIAAHKGEIWVKSALGQGSTFSFTLPTASRAERHITVELVPGTGDENLSAD